MSREQLIASLNQRFESASQPTPTFRLEGEQAIADFRGLRLASAFEPLVGPRGEPRGFFAQVRVADAAGRPLPAEAAYAAAEDRTAVVRLDRVLRTLHAFNGRELAARAPLFLPIHPRHVAEVGEAHGDVFGSILAELGLRSAQVVLAFGQPPAAGLEHAARAVASFRAHGFGIALRETALQGEDREAPVWRALQPDVLVLDAAYLLFAEAGELSLEVRLAAARSLGAHVFVTGVGDALQAQLARRHGFDAWGQATAEQPRPEPSLPRTPGWLARLRGFARGAASAAGG